MRKKIILFILVIALTTIGFSQDSPMRISYISGNVMVQRGYDFGFEDAQLNLPIVSGDRIMSENGRAELELRGRNFMRIDEFTKADIEERGNSINFKLLKGAIYLHIRNNAVYEDFVVSFPRGETVILEEGDYRFTVREANEVEIKVFRGVAEVYCDDGTKYVRRSQILILRDGRFVSSPSYIYYSDRDDFDRWNDERNSIVDNFSYSRGRYLRDNLSYYEDELNRYGRWVYISGCGYCWRPIITVTVWRPYYYGRWTWVYPYGWVWVSYEPFGWITYHYGWWYWDPYYGWVWRPGYSWAPAWVRWYYWGDYIAWVPIDWYGHPVIIVNGRRWRRYDRLPITARSVVVLRKNQLMAKNIAKIAVSTKTLTLKKATFKPLSAQPYAVKSIKKVKVGNKYVLKRSFKAVTKATSKTSVLAPSSKYRVISTKKTTVKTTFTKPTYKKPTTTYTNSKKTYTTGGSTKKYTVKRKTIKKSSPTSSSTYSGTSIKKKKVKKKNDSYVYNSSSTYYNKPESSNENSYKSTSSYYKRRYTSTYRKPYYSYYNKKSQNSYDNVYKNYYSKSSSAYRSKSSYKNYYSPSYKKSYNYSSSSYKKSYNYYSPSKKTYSYSSGSSSYKFKSSSSSYSRSSYSSHSSSSSSSSSRRVRKKD